LVENSLFGRVLDMMIILGKGHSIEFTLLFCVLFSYILKVPFDNDSGGIVYVWNGG
jgi:hypothetical protein